MKSILLFLIISLQLFANIGNIMVLKGEAEIHRSQNKVLPASSGMTILLGDQIITADKARAQIILKDDTIITIGANSSFQFDKYFFDGTSKSTIKMKATRGFFRSVTGKIGELAPERFTVETSSATIGIRGTDFSARIEKSIERFKCYSGGITITIGDLVKELGAGELFEFAPNQMHISPQMRKKAQQERFSPQTRELADITEEIEQREHIKEPVHPEPIIPNGVPCAPCPSQP